MILRHDRILCVAIMWGKNIGKFDKICEKQELFSRKFTTLRHNRILHIIITIYLHVVTFTAFKNPSKLEEN